MTYYSQKDQRWANEKLGTCSDTIAKSGCKITCLASFCGKTPSEVNKIIPYVSGCLTNDETAAKALGLPFGGKSTVKPNFDCIAETDHYKSKGVPQHFFILLADGRCVDPLDLNPVPKKNPYKIVSYRLFKPLITEESMQKEFVEAVEAVTGEKYGANINDSEQKDAAKKLKEVETKLDWIDQLEKTNARLLENNETLAAQIVSMKAEISDMLDARIASANAEISVKDSVIRQYEDKAGIFEQELATCRENLRIASEKANDGISAYSISGLFGEIIRRLISSK